MVQSLQGPDQDGAKLSQRGRGKSCTDASRVSVLQGFVVWFYCIFWAQIKLVEVIAGGIEGISAWMLFVCQGLLAAIFLQGSHLRFLVAEVRTQFIYMSFFKKKVE